MVLRWDIHSQLFMLLHIHSLVFKLYIATEWNPIYWNTACLIVNSGSLEEEDEFEEDEDGNVVQKKEKSN